MIYITGDCHGNFERFNASIFPEQNEMWNSGKIHRIRPSVIHLMRGQVYELEDKKIFTFGGASSHDIDGVFWNWMIHIIRKRRRNWIRAGNHIASII